MQRLFCGGAVGSVFGEAGVRLQGCERVGVEYSSVLYEIFGVEYDGVLYESGFVAVA